MRFSSVFFQGSEKIDERIIMHRLQCFLKKPYKKRVLSLELGVPVVLINVMHHTVCVKLVSRER